jgi:hypothetical protein
VLVCNYVTPAGVVASLNIGLADATALLADTEAKSSDDDGLVVIEWYAVDDGLLPPNDPETMVWACTSRPLDGRSFFHVPAGDFHSFRPSADDDTPGGTEITSITTHWSYECWPKGA